MLGQQIARIHSNEFQKRGLPHTHILIWLAAEDKPRTPADYDKFVSAEIPDPIKNKALYDTVTQCMIHGPCNEACLKDGVCKKRFPKPFSEETHLNGEGCPVYRRRHDSQTAGVRRGIVNCQYVVPYNPWLLHKYNCHINVEVCSTGCNQVPFQVCIQRT